jgi:hypothetical protein
VIARLLLRHPFQPFTLHLPDAVDVTVEAPDQVEHPQNSQLITIKDRDGTETIIDLYLVARITIRRPKR